MISKQNCLRIALAVTCTLTAFAAAFAQGVDTAWVRRWDGVALNDGAAALALDALGNPHVAGHTRDSVTSDDYLVIRYTPEGDIVWVRTYDGPGNSMDQARAMVIDPAGNVYVTGWSWGPAGSMSMDYATLKYSQAGQLLWTARYNGPDSLWDGADAIALCPDGGVVVTGRSASSVGWYDVVTVKYRSDGDSVWQGRYDGPAHYADEGADVACDNLGNTYVAGFSTGLSSGSDYILICYDSLGGVVWVRSYNGPAGDLDRAAAVACDSAGAIYVTGNSAGVGSGQDVFTVKYNRFGDTLWTRRYNGPGNGNDGGVDLSVDESGWIYVAGYSAGISSSRDLVTLKYSPAGDLEWVARTGSPAGNCGPTAMAVRDGDVYVAGYTIPSPGYTDCLTVKYNASGDSVWAAVYAGPVPSDSVYDVAAGIALDATGNVYVSGSSEVLLTGDDAFTIKYRQVYPPVIYPLAFYLFSPVDMVVTDPKYDSIGPTFNTIGDGSSYDESTDWDNDGEPDDIVTIPNPVAGDYSVRIYPEEGAPPDAEFTLGIRIDGNIMLYPEDYQDVALSELGTTVPDTYVWTAETTLCGDCNGDGQTTAADIIYLVNYVFKDGPEPVVPTHGDTNCDGQTTAADIIYLVAHIFRSGPAPCSQTGN